MNQKTQDYWEKFLLKTNQNKDTKCFDVFYFGHNEQLATSLLELVLQGTKTATTSSVYQYELENIEYPKTGDFSIVTDFNGTPKCIIETKKVLKLKFDEVTYDICKAEGEDDSLASWRQNHVTFFTAVGKKMGFEFSFDMPVIFEYFEVVYK